MKKEIEINERFEKIEGRVTDLENKLKPSKEGKLIICDCGYKWFSNAKLNTTSCPDCGNKCKV